MASDNFFGNRFEQLMNESPLIAHLTLKARNPLGVLTPGGNKLFNEPDSNSFARQAHDVLGTFDSYQQARVALDEQYSKNLERRILNLGKGRSKSFHDISAIVKARDITATARKRYERERETLGEKAARARFDKLVTETALKVGELQGESRRVSDEARERQLDNLKDTFERQRELDRIKFDFEEDQLDAFQKSSKRQQREVRRTANNNIRRIRLQGERDHLRLQNAHDNLVASQRDRISRAETGIDKAQLDIEKSIKDIQHINQNIKIRQDYFSENHKIESQFVKDQREAITDSYYSAVLAKDIGLRQAAAQKAEQRLAQVTQVDSKGDSSNSLVRATAVTLKTLTANLKATAAIENREALTQLAYKRAIDQASAQLNQTGSRLQRNRLVTSTNSQLLLNQASRESNSLVVAKGKLKLDISLYNTMINSANEAIARSSKQTTALQKLLDQIVNSQVAGQRITARQRINTIKDSVADAERRFGAYEESYRINREQKQADYFEKVQQSRDQEKILDINDQLNLANSDETFARNNTPSPSTRRIGGRPVGYQPPQGTPSRIDNPPISRIDTSRATSFIERYL